LLDFKNINGFDWDKGNSGKNLRLHDVLDTEAEEIYFNQPLLIESDDLHSSDSENRFYALGKTNNDRFLFIAFTIRKHLIRVISARNMTRVEREIYEKI
jgi:hypothetical protein